MIFHHLTSYTYDEEVNEMVTVRFKNMPTKIKSFVQKDDDADTIVINSRLSHEQQRCCYIHEIQHLRRGDFEKESVQEIEAEAHGKVKK